MTMVRSNLEYFVTVWNPYKKDHIHKLEMDQRRAARFETKRFHNTSSVTDMLDHLQWETIEARRCKLQLTMFYKIVNNIVDIDKDLYLTPATTKTKQATQRSTDISPPPATASNTAFFQNLSASGTNS